MYRILPAFAVLLAALAVGTPAQAQGYLLDDLIYYEIGGAHALGGPASYRRHARIRGSGGLALGYGCGAFDLEQNLKQMFDQFSSGLDRAVDTLTYAASGAVASLPLYLLRQANPNLANMLENTMLRYEDEYRLSVKSCQEAEEEILAGKNPYYDWVKFGKHDTWRKSAGSGETATRIRERTATQHGCITWIGGEQYFCDESDSREIRVYGDVAREGYRLLSEGGVSGPAGALPARLTEYWPAPEKAVEEILDITGETTITNARSTPPAGQPPRGAAAGMHEDASKRKEALAEAIDQSFSRELTADEMEALGAPGLAVTPSLLRALRNMEPGLRETAVERISTEIALLRSLEKVNLARRVILAGASLPEVQASPAREMVMEEALPLLESEARLLKDEYDLRTRAASSTAAAVIRADIRRQQGADGGQNPSPGTPTTRGAQE